MRFHTWGALALLLAMPALAEPKRIDMGPAGILQLEMPAGWNVTRQGPSAPGGAALVITPPAPETIVVLITPYPVPTDKDADAAAREFLTSRAETISKNAEERSLPLLPIDPGAEKGYFLTATDKTVARPTATDFKYLEEGVVACDPILLQYTILTNDLGGPGRARAHAFMRGAQVHPPRN